MISRVSLVSRFCVSRRYLQLEAAHPKELVGLVRAYVRHLELSEDDLRLREVRVRPVHVAGDAAVLFHAAERDEREDSLLPDHLPEAGHGFGDGRLCGDELLGRAAEGVSDEVRVDVGVCKAAGVGLQRDHRVGVC